MNYEFNLLDHVGGAAKASECGGGGDGGARRGRQCPFGSNEPRAKNRTEDDSIASFVAPSVTAGINRGVECLREL